jgi:hypothetical protein
MDALEIMAKMFELLKLYSRKAELATDIAELRVSGLVRDRGRDLSLHMRDEHQRFYDDSYFMEAWTEDQEKKERLRNEYSEVCTQIKPLAAMLQELLPEAAFPVG